MIRIKFCIIAIIMSVLLILFIEPYFPPVQAAPAADTGYALQFDSAKSQYVTFGRATGPHGYLYLKDSNPLWSTENPFGVGKYSLSFNPIFTYLIYFGPGSDLGLKDFTIELWFKKGTNSISTKTGGGISAIPIITKGGNYFFGLKPDGTLIIEFQDTNSAFHSLYGTQAVSTGWHHAAASYNSTTGDYVLFLDGNIYIEQNLTDHPIPITSSTHFAIGTKITPPVGLGNINSSGWYAGNLTEVRLWNVARTLNQIRTYQSSKLEAPYNDPTLTARWGLDEGSGKSINDTANNAKPTLGLETFTLETWFKRTGSGIASTLDDSIKIVPLITKGVAEGDGGLYDINYFLGFKESTNEITFLYEDSGLGVDHVLSTAVKIGVDEPWHHVAVTYDGQVVKIYLDGVLDPNTLSTTLQPQSRSIAYVALGSALCTRGLPASEVHPTPAYFTGLMDETRIWSIARTQAEIRSTINTKITSGTGLVARWGMDEGTGSVISDSINQFNGTLVGTSGPTFVQPGAPFNAPTAVTVASFSGSSVINIVQLRWETASEEGLVGFNIYRSGTNMPEEQKVNDELIPALHPGQLTGDSYEFTDIASLFQRYTYRLELVKTDGNWPGPQVDVVTGFRMFLPVLGN
jgi:hypothetical protein